MRRAITLGALVTLLLATPLRAGGSAPEVNILFSAYAPTQLDVLPGETVTWTNVSERTHTVTSDTGLFDSGDVVGGAHFAFTFDDTGAYAYHCTIHPSIVGEIDVRRVILGPLPTAAVTVGARIVLTGRAADTSTPIDIQLRSHGSQFKTVARATPDADGDWKTVVRATATGDYRATSGSDSSETRRLLVNERRVLVHATRRGIRVTVTPSAPYARILVEIYARERFGWWPVSRYRLNYVSEADIPLPRPASVRVVLVDRDGWTPVAISRQLRL